SAEYFDEQRRFLAGLSTPVTPMFNGALFDLSPMHDKLVDALRPSRASMDYCRAEETGALSPRDIAVRPPNPSLPARNLANVERAAMLNGNRAAPRDAVAERECCWRGISCVDSQISPHCAHRGVTTDERLCYRHKQ